MNVWSDYLRAQAELADRMARTMVTPESRREFAEIAGGFRRDADLEDATPTLPRRATPMERGYPPTRWLS